MILWFFTLLLSCVSINAEEKAPPAIESIRVDEDDKAARLQTSIATWEKDGVRVDLIGAVHIADKAYYETLNQTFTQYESLLFEMVGGEKLGKQPADKPEESEKEEKPDAKKNSLSGLSEIYATVANFLGLVGQSEVVNYHADNFVHADLTLAEFEEKQKERKESLIGLAMKSSIHSTFNPKAKQPDSSRLLAAMLLGKSDMMKLELIHTLGGGDDQISAFAGDTVIITDRNAKCLEVMDAEIAKGRKKLGIFYGAAHFPDMEKTLTARGWKRTGETWLTAWDVPKPVKKEPAEKPVP
jgi:hypothetical protein